MTNGPKFTRLKKKKKYTYLISTTVLQYEKRFFSFTKNTMERVTLSEVHTLYFCLTRGDALLLCVIQHGDSPTYTYRNCLFDAPSYHERRQNVLPTNLNLPRVHDNVKIHCCKEGFFCTRHHERRLIYRENCG